MTSLRRLASPFALVLFVTLTASFCIPLQAEEKKPAASGSKGKKEAPAALKLPFDRAAVKRVEAIRFKAPGESDKPDAQPADPYTFLGAGGKTDFTKLRELTVKKADLTEAQIGTLIQGVYGKNEKMPPAACYDPHHLFLFYDGEGKIINVVELCFSCTNVNSSPPMPEANWYRHDFRKLAKLCDEAGIGLESKTAAEYVRMLDVREGKE